MQQIFPSPVPETQEEYIKGLLASVSLFEASALEAIQTLNIHFTSALILHHSDSSLLFLVEMDASQSGMGAALDSHQYCVPYSGKPKLAEVDDTLDDTENNQRD